MEDGFHISSESPTEMLKKFPEYCASLKYAVNKSPESIIKKYFARNEKNYNNKYTQEFLSNFGVFTKPVVSKPDIKPTKCLSHVISGVSASNDKFIFLIIPTFKKHCATGKSPIFKSIVNSDFNGVLSHSKYFSDNKDNVLFNNYKTVELKKCNARVSKIWVHPSSLFEDKPRNMCNSKPKSTFLDFSPIKESKSSVDLSKINCFLSKRPSTSMITKNNNECFKNVRENLVSKIKSKISQNALHLTNRASKILSSAVSVISTKSLPTACKKETFADKLKETLKFIEADSVSKLSNNNCFINNFPTMNSIKYENSLPPSIKKDRLMVDQYTGVKNRFLHHNKVFSETTFPCKSNSFVEDRINLKIPFLDKNKYDNKNNLSKTSSEFSKNKKSTMKSLVNQTSIILNEKYKITRK